jgi:hypothetical protein
MPSSRGESESAFKTPNYRNGSENAAQYGSRLLSCITTHWFRPIFDEGTAWLSRHCASGPAPRADGAHEQWAGHA